MKMQKIEDLKKEILNILRKSPIDPDTATMHAQLVHKWVLALKPNADEALQIAALSHDIEKAFTGITEKNLKDYSKINEFKNEHAERSAKFISEILKKHNYSDDIIHKVKLLVSNHEMGGDEESNILRDADSIAFFEYNIPSYLKNNGRERTKKKINFMYKRMSSNAKETVKHLTYENLETKKIVDEL